MTATVSLLGLAFADLTAAAAAEAIARRPANAPFGYVVTPNADHLVRMSRDPELAGLYRGAWMRLLDSRVVAALGVVCGLPVPGVAPGSDITRLLFDRYIHSHENVTIIGLRSASLPLLAARYGLAGLSHYDPPMGFDSNVEAVGAAVAFILAHPARFVFLAVGSPRQERLAAAVAATGLATGTGLCIGASLGFLTGAERRAPRWMQRSGLEWAFRLLRDPRRLARRYLIDSPGIVPLLLRARRAAR